MLGRVPPLPDRLTYGLITLHPLESNWRVTGSTICEASEKSIQIPPVQLRWVIGAPTKVTLSGNSFRSWSEFKGDDQSNLLAILVLVWSYILSARLMELQGQGESRLVYTQSRAPLYQAHESVSGFLLDVGDVATRELRWFTAILAPESGFRFSPLQQDAFSHHAPWETCVVAPSIPFSIRYGEGCKDLGLNGQMPLTSYEALQSLIALCNRHAVSRSQLHAALATALLLPTHNYLQLDPALPHPEIRDTGFPAAKLRSEDLDQLFEDLPRYITLSCASEVINSSLCGVFWNPHVPCNLASPWLQPMWDLQKIKEVQSAPGRYAEVLALICARRAPNTAFLSIAAAISGLTPKILDQVSSGQPPLENHAYAWTGVPQSFMDIAGKGRYFEMRCSEAYIRRSDCWRLRRLPPTIDDDLHYSIGPFTPWEPAGWGLLRNCPLRVQAHINCDRHAMAYQGVTWYFCNGRKLEDDMGKDSIIPHVSPDSVVQGEVSHDVPSLDNEDTSLDATIASFRWVLDNGEGSPPEDAYKDPWLSHLYESGLEGDGMSSDRSSYTGEAQRKVGSSIDSYLELGTRIRMDAASTEETDADKRVLVWTCDDLK
ncbi:MAG: hypothetical protein Q9217_006796 [Psora testacea]